MSDSDRNPARDAFILGWALMTGAATAAPDDDFEAARGAFITAPRSAVAVWVVANLLITHTNVGRGAERLPAFIHRRLPGA
jgi:hypothetical protein